MTEWDVIAKICKQKLNEIEQLRKKVEKSLKKAPEGVLNISDSRGNIQYYHKTPETSRRGKYLKKEEMKLIRALAQKDYDLHLVQELKKQKTQIEQMLKKIPEIELRDFPQTLIPARRELVQPHIQTDEDFIEEWQSVSYSGKNWIEDEPKLETERGEKVRSKSEKILADKLYSMRIPYRYEYPLEVDGYRVIYPDFTLLKMPERKEIYFEHFGMMDDQEYCRKTVLKLQTYARNHIYPGKNLLMTFETLKTPLDMKSVENMLREFLFDSYMVFGEEIQRFAV